LQDDLDGRRAPAAQTHDGIQWQPGRECPNHTRTPTNAAKTSGKTQSRGT